MDSRDELRQLRTDFFTIYLAWRHYPRRTLGVWVLAALRVFTWHPDNNRFRKLMFFVVTALVGTLLVGQSGFGWRLAPVVLVPVVATWLIAFGVVLGFEVRRIKIANLELDLTYGEVRDAKQSDDSD
jgi:fatty acid desaturase